nr:YifB family Mg chelatase-like AAA ATPase [Anaeromicropila herbilytica]
MEESDERSYMFSKAYSAAIHGIDGVIVNVEADVSDGLPTFEMVGFLSSEVREAKERVRISIKNSGFRLSPKRITINLSPADLKKEGTAFDLPIAVTILSAFGYITQSNLEHTLIIGELSLNGQINPVNGVLPIVHSAKEQGFYRCIVPIANVKEGAVVSDIDVIGVNTLEQVVQYLNNDKYIEPEYVDIDSLFQNQMMQSANDFSDVTGQESTKRAILVAVSGMHNILMIGPPGSGKTMLSKRIPSIMPELSFDESMEISKVYSVAGLLDNNHALVLERPFRAPHHTITTSALAGGGKVPRPGEISLASRGVLFLDELPEFNKNTLEILRQPLEDKSITIARLNATYSYPTAFMLVAAMNPCNCGYYPDRKRCNCSINEVKRYLGKVSMPLMDRVDICSETYSVNYKDLEKKENSVSSLELRKEVKRVREIQLERYKNEKFNFNSLLTPQLMNTYCGLERSEKKLLEDVFDKLNLTARAYHKILKVARTIADLDDSERIKRIHLSEAISYRSIDKKYWGE